MINNEVQRDKQYFQQTLQQSKMDLTSYLAMVKQTDEEFTKQLEGTATKRLQSQLLLEALMKQEKIEVTDEDITAEIKKMKPECDTPEKVEVELKKLNRDGFKVMIKQNKVFDLLTKQAKISEKKAEKVK